MFMPGKPLYNGKKSRPLPSSAPPGFSIQRYSQFIWPPQPYFIPFWKIPARIELLPVEVSRNLGTGHPDFVLFRPQAVGLVPVLDRPAPEFKPMGLLNMCQCQG